MYLRAILIAFALSLTVFVFAKSYSAKDQKGRPLDEKIVKILGCQPGFFVEAGAHDGLAFSNTALLEKKYGWYGILVEPSPSLFDCLRYNRPHSKCFECALGSFEENGTCIEGDFNGDLMSSVNAEHSGNNEKMISVPMRSLQSILDECCVDCIDFLSLDVAGYEYNVLNGIDFNKTEFDYMLIAIYEGDDEKIVPFLKEKGYNFVEEISLSHLASKPHGSSKDYLFKRDRQYRSVDVQQKLQLYP